MVAGVTQSGNRRDAAVRTARSRHVRDNGRMPRLDRIYTKTGDEGMTGLGGGQRVAKDSLRVEAYGTVDELNSHIGVALAIGLCERLAAELPAIQNQLFDLGADLATPATSPTLRNIQATGRVRIGVGLTRDACHGIHQSLSHLPTAHYPRAGRRVPHDAPRRRLT